MLDETTAPSDEPPAEPEGEADRLNDEELNDGVEVLDESSTLNAESYTLNPKYERD